MAVSSPATGMVSLFGLDPATYRPHPVHSGERTYIETDCFTDLVVELLHARGDEPLASFGSFVRMDFENDQWIFFKPLAVDLEQLFGMDIHETQPYRSIPAQIAELLALGRTMTVELDAWHLPDTAATTYGTAHVKTGVIAEAIDLDVPAPVITLSLLQRLTSRDTDSFSDKLLAAMRQKFGGHAVKTEAKK